MGEDVRAGLPGEQLTYRSAGRGAGSTARRTSPAEALANLAGQAGAAHLLGRVRLGVRPGGRGVPAGLDFTIDDIETRPFLTIVAVAVTAQLAVHAVLRTYRGRHPIGGIDEAVTVATGTALVGMVVFLVGLFTHQQLIPHSVPLLAAPIAVVVAVGSRLAVRLYRERRYRADYSRAHRVIVLGAGIDGQHLLRSLLSDPAGRYLPVALLEDNQSLRRYRISGVAVRGTRADVAHAAAEANADMLIIADRSLSTPAVERSRMPPARQAWRWRCCRPSTSCIRPLPDTSLPDTSPIPAPRMAAEGILVHGGTGHRGKAVRAGRRRAEPHENGSWTSR